EFLDKAQITEEIKKKIIAIKDISYTDEFGLQELLEKCQDVLAKEEVTEEKEIMNKFFKQLAEEAAKVAYGEVAVRNALGIGAVDTLLLSETIDDNLSDELEAKATQTGCQVRIISIETREGIQLRDMGGIAAILRYALS
ncbi:peptide chain release factor 1, partial [Candidatus Woesearchaeota archaeon]|nr:peptide chain release factor 1 [Candidatus Woesearchaeota archaeon]